MNKFNFEFFSRLLYSLYKSSQSSDLATYVMTFEDFDTLGLSKNDNGNISPHFVYHLQLAQNEGLIYTFLKKEGVKTQPIPSFCLTEKGYSLCYSLFAEGMFEFLMDLSTEVTFPVVLQTCHRQYPFS